MKLIAAILLSSLLCFQHTGYSQVSNNLKKFEKGNLSGKVTTENGEPLSGASIYIHDIKTGAVTNESGLYSTPEVNAGRYLVEVTHLGFSTFIQFVDINGKTQKDFVLNSVVVEQEAVTVTGVSSATRAKQSPQPVSILERGDFLQNSSTNLMQALTRKPGINIITTGPAIAKPVIRGLGYNRIVTMNDGVRQEGQQWGDEHGIEIDEYSAQKVEVLKGPASLMYGSDAIAGVINVITNRPIAPGQLRGNVLTTFNANNRLYGFNANLAAHNENGFNWNAYTSLKSAGNYSNKFDGKVLNSGYNERNFGGYLGVNKSWGYSHLVFSTLHQKIGLIEGDRDSATGKFLINTGTPLEMIAPNSMLNSRSLQVPNQTINHTKIALDNSIALGRGRLAATVGFQVNRRQEFGDINDPEEAELFMSLNTFTYNLTYHLADQNGWRTSFGANGMYQFHRNLADERIIPDYNLFDAGIFAITKKSFNKLNVSGGLRADFRNIHSEEFADGSDIKFNAFDKSFANISGSAGASYDVNKQLVIKANIARGYRSPNMAELASNGAHEGTNRFEYGSQDLKTETSLQADLGFEYDATHFSFGLNAFYNHISDYIFYRRLLSVSGSDSIVNHDGEDLFAFQFSQSSARLAGFEANFDIHPHPLDWLHFENTFTLVDGRFTNAIEGVRQLPFIPAARLLSELRGNFSKAGKHFKNLYVKAEMDYNAPRNNVFTAFNTETSTPSYTLLNIGAGSDIVCRKKTIASVYLTLNNITDVAYQNHLSRLKYTAENNVTGRQGVFNMGRNFSLRVNVPLNFK